MCVCEYYAAEVLMMDAPRTKLLQTRRILARLAAVCRSHVVFL